MKETKAVEERGGRGGHQEEEEPGTDGSQGRRLRLNLHQLQKENLELMSTHNQEVRTGKDR